MIIFSLVPCQAQSDCLIHVKFQCRRGFDTKTFPKGGCQTWFAASPSTLHYPRRAKSGLTSGKVWEEGMRQFVLPRRKCPRSNVDHNAERPAAEPTSEQILSSCGQEEEVPEQSSHAWPGRNVLESDLCCVSTSHCSWTKGVAVCGGSACVCDE